MPTQVKMTIKAEIIHGMTTKAQWKEIQHWIRSVDRQINQLLTVKQNQWKHLVNTEQTLGTRPEMGL